MKKLILIAGVISAAFAANASYLYWQVSNGAYDGSEYNSAKLIFTQGTIDNWGEYTAAQNDGVFTADGTYHAYSTSKDKVGVSSDSAYAANIGSLENGSSYSYWVELYNNNTRVGLSSIGHIDSYNPDNLPQFVYANTDNITTSLAEVAAVAVWHASSYGPVPEPTSAILMLFGAAFLGLKRKNRSLA